jgi:intracellular sulfur oxidation DsrE/DsrF family protein
MKVKAIFHIDEIEKWDLLIENVENLLKGIEYEEYEIEILANSKAVNKYKKGNAQEANRLEQLSKKKVNIIACNNALNSQKISRDMLFPYIKVVPIGVKELIEKQLEGYAYIKP